MSHSTAGRFSDYIKQDMKLESHWHWIWTLMNKCLYSAGERDHSTHIKIQETTHWAIVFLGLWVCDILLYQMKGFCLHQIESKKP